MAPVDRVLAVDLYGCAVVFEEFERVIAEGGAGLIISSMAGHMMPELPPSRTMPLPSRLRTTSWHFLSCNETPFPIQWWGTCMPSGPTICE
jgi:hypothetical protein